MEITVLTYVSVQYKVYDVYDVRRVYGVSSSVSNIEVASTRCSGKAYRVPHGIRYSIDRIVSSQKKLGPDR